MTKALSVLATGELFRIASMGSLWSVQSIKDSVRVDCFNALLKETRKGKRSYDKIVTFVFDSRLHKIVETAHDRVISDEKRRARELVCWRHHRGRCGPPPYEVVKEAPKSVSRDDVWWEKERLRVIGLALEHLKTPQLFDRTRLSVLTLDLENVYGWFRKRAMRVEGIGNGGTAESGAGP